MRINKRQVDWAQCVSKVITDSKTWYSCTFGCGTSETGLLVLNHHHHHPLQWGAADAEIKVPSGENTALKRSPFKAWSRSVYSHTCYAYCQGFLPCLFLPFQSIHLHFFQNLSRFFLCWLWLTHGSCEGPQNKIGHPAWCRFPCWMPAEYKWAKKHDLWYDDLWNE